MESPDCSDRPAEPSDFHIVGIGASAGGLDSLERLFTHLPADTGMAFIVLQHLSPDFRSLMDELLGRRTTMRIRQAESDMLVEPDTVYLLPPMKEMIIRQRRLLLNDKDPRIGLALPIDLFLRSLAQDVGDRAVAVILSGSGSDGSRGVLEISKAGGTVFCESPDTAQFNGMPLSAMRSGRVNQVLPPEQIAVALAALGNRGAARRPDIVPAPSERGIDAIVQLLRDEYAIDFSHYKASTVVRRIERRLALNRSLDVDMYVEQLRSDSRELSSLYEDLLIGVTRFFRDDDAFGKLEDVVLPELLERTPPDHSLRVWVPGCATGQEAYSIAILLHEALSARKRPINMKILATDVHKASLEIASAGVYSEEQTAGVSAERLERFFTLRANGYHISQSLRECIVFAPHNLIRDAPFTNLDLISCRNLLIYLQPHAQKTVLTLFHFALKPGGILLLGSSESPGGLVGELETIDERGKIFRKLRDVSLPRDLKLPLPRSTAAPRLSTPSPRGGVSPQLMSVYDRMLDQFMPPSFLVDDQGHLVDTFGGLDAFLKIKSRRPTHYLPEMLPEALRAVASSALHRARNDLQSVRYPGIQIPGHRAEFSFIAQPYRDAHGRLTHVLISLGDTAAGTGGPAPALIPPFVDVPTPQVEAAPAIGSGPAGDDTSRDRIRALEEELAYARDHLQSAIEEHETSNEELQATNEELIAANEELQSTNEELHSVNEELYTVNAEYQRKNAELQELNDDIEHLLNGTDVATLFLDRQLCIRKFTPRIADIFRIIPQDVGRPLQGFAHDLVYPTLFTDIERVLHDGAGIEAQAWDRRQHCYFLRILPYRARSRERVPAVITGAPREAVSPDGVLLTLTDISALEQVRARLAQLSAIVESSDDAIIGKTLDGIITSWNRGATRLYGYRADEIIGRHASVLYPPGHKEDLDRVLREIRKGRSVERQEMVRMRSDGTLVHASVTFSPIYDRENTVTGLSAISRDITQLVAARQEIADREERIRLLLDSTAEAIYGIDLSGACIFCNSACARLLGYPSPAALIGRQMHPLVHHTRPDGTPNAAEQSAIFEAMRRREGIHVEDEVLWRADGSSFPAEYWSHPILKDDQIIGAVVTFLDVTTRREAERELQEAARRREQFLAMLSHELRNPLAAILSATRLLEREASLNDHCRQAGQVIERQATHMARLLDDLLDVSRIAYGRIVLRNELVDLRETARSAIEALEPLLAERQTDLTVSLPEEPVLLVGDPARLQQIQANLLSNASKYSPPESGIRFEILVENGEAVIRVSDRGRGIAADELPRIFDLFVQGDRSLDRSEGGLGIGLTLLRSLVELHQGTVEAHSDGPGCGSTFTVRMPLAPATFSATHIQAPSPRPVRTAVIVEDQSDARLMMKMLLESYGVIVHTAADGVEGVSLIKEVRPDLAIVDLGLPIMSGFELARRVRGDEQIRDTRLIALSGYGQESDIEAALDAGFDEHLTKPTDPARLEEIVRPATSLAGTTPDSPASAPESR